MEMNTIQKIEDAITKFTPLDSCPVKADAQKSRRKRLLSAIVKIFEDEERSRPFAPKMEYKGGNVGESNL